MAVHLAFALAAVIGTAPHGPLITLGKYLDNYFLLSKFYFGGADILLAAYLGHLIIKLTLYLVRRVKFNLNLRRLS
jgi:hypothetical protein